MSVPLAPDHKGMRVNALRFLKKSQGPGYSFMRQQMAEHLEELGRRFYAGDLQVVDEFLQLYCFAENDRKRAVAEQTEKEAQP